jgi:hypothetical protein
VGLRPKTAGGGDSTGSTGQVLNLPRSYCTTGCVRSCTRGALTQASCARVSERDASVVSTQKIIKYQNSEAGEGIVKCARRGDEHAWALRNCREEDYCLDVSIIDEQQALWALRCRTMCCVQSMREGSIDVFNH